MVMYGWDNIRGGGGGDVSSEIFLERPIYLTSIIYTTHSRIYTIKIPIYNFLVQELKIFFTYYFKTKKLIKRLFIL